MVWQQCCGQRLRNTPATLTHRLRLLERFSHQINIKQKAPHLRAGLLLAIVIGLLKYYLDNIVRENKNHQCEQKHHTDLLSGFKKLVARLTA